ncbi:uncharacterized protein LOC131954408 [Physella acuta]|uniref:uncharacterized protein LOC131954408 n=1 Tax=Physella acuta TaxID=109671 RepID=UPI0027DBCC2C|nr:uncharacterized protein LOC131954408 [Physella acuta]
MFVKTISLLALAAFTSAQTPSGSGSFNCPSNEMRNYEYQNDCTKYWQCDGGVPTLSDCSPQLIFDPRNGTCVYPLDSSRPNCNEEAARNLRIPRICLNPPAGSNPKWAFVVPHERYCNAYFTCSLNYLYAQCSFCGEGMYFNEGAGGCRDARGVNLQNVCRGKEYVEHRDIVLRTLDNSCSLYFGAGVNPYQLLIDLLLGGRSTAPLGGDYPTTGRPQTTRPFNG